MGIRLYDAHREKLSSLAESLSASSVLAHARVLAHASCPRACPTACLSTQAGAHLCAFNILHMFNNMRASTLAHVQQHASIHACTCSTTRKHPRLHRFNNTQASTLAHVQQTALRASNGHWPPWCGISSLVTARTLNLAGVLRRLSWCQLAGKVRSNSRLSSLAMPSSASSMPGSSRRASSVSTWNPGMGERGVGQERRGG